MREFYLIQHNDDRGEFYTSQDVFDKLKAYNVNSEELFYQRVNIFLNKNLPNNTLIATGELAKIAKELEL